MKPKPRRLQSWSDIESATKEIEKLRKSLKEMLDCYWGEGDGAPPPAFIKRALKLVS